MKSLLALSMLFCALTLSAQKVDKRYFELRIYYTYPGRMDALLSRFENHTTKIFEKHGMENIGYWLPVEGNQEVLYYILAYPNKEARDKSWTAFSSDPEWKQVQAKSEESGKIVDSVASVFMNASDIMPKIKPGSGKNRVFELRTYTCLPGRLPNLITRFKDHTVKLFEKHGMENIVYFTTVEKDGSQPKLVYLLAHKSKDDAKKSWDAFRSDPVWVEARDASEKDGKIVEKVESVYLTPTGFSKIK
ncbi:NIPSNAP family protein [Chryseolinea sp. T2]|uniref:NIPSNAP family protein n=1 Tax=Chryseolinea sp. T2 TaxID=3129255 RepID=UPI003076A78E